MRSALLVSIVLIPFSGSAASLIGAIIDPAGASIAGVVVELDSGTKKYEARTDNFGGYQFANLPAGEYTLVFKPEGFKWLTVKSIGLIEGEAKRVPEITLALDVLCDFRLIANLSDCFLGLSMGR